VFFCIFWMMMLCSFCSFYMPGYFSA
jgi:hypothetical protein